MKMSEPYPWYIYAVIGVTGFLLLGHGGSVYAQNPTEGLFAMVFGAMIVGFALGGRVLQKEKTSNSTENDTKGDNKSR